MICNHCFKSLLLFQFTLFTTEEEHPLLTGTYSFKMVVYEKKFLVVLWTEHSD